MIPLPPSCVAPVIAVPGRSLDHSSGSTLWIDTDLEDIMPNNIDMGKLTGLLLASSSGKCNILD